MFRNLVFVFIVGAIALVSGCGGGSPGPGPGVSSNIQPGQYFEFFRSNGSWFDPLNLLLGDSGTVVLANYDSLGNRTLLTTSGWATTSGGAVNIGATSGTTASFTVIGTPAAEFKFQCFSVIAGVQTLFEQRARTPLSTPVVTGRVVELGLFSGLPTNTGVPHIEVDFFDGSGTIVGSARTMPNGTFSAIVPLTAVETMLVADTIKTSKYYRAIFYQSNYYSPLDVTCRIALGALINGVNAMPASMALPQEAGGPPPPPTGCP